jgi:hypothetical protein
VCKVGKSNWYLMFSDEPYSDHYDPMLPVGKDGLGVFLVILCYVRSFKHTEVKYYILTVCF